jgi:hypothetical protein
VRLDFQAMIVEQRELRVATPHPVHLLERCRYFCGLGRLTWLGISVSR